MRTGAGADQDQGEQLPGESELQVSSSHLVYNIESAAPSPIPCHPISLIVVCLQEEISALLNDFNMSISEERPRIASIDLQ